jgi:hypothetical protein
MQGRENDEDITNMDTPIGLSKVKLFFSIIICNTKKKEKKKIIIYKEAPELTKI